MIVYVFPAFCGITALANEFVFDAKEAREVVAEPMTAGVLGELIAIPPVLV